jgi:hypothetical protein
MPVSIDGPASPLFQPITFQGNCSPGALRRKPVSDAMKAQADQAPMGRCVAWGVPFDIGRLLIVSERPETIVLPPLKTPWLIFLHTSDIRELDANSDGFYSPARGTGRLGEAAADYIFQYTDGTEIRHTLRRRHEIGMFQRVWGENAFECVAHKKPRTLRPLTAQLDQKVPWDPGLNYAWGTTQTQVMQPDLLPWINWVWAWPNPHPRKTLAALRIEPREAVLVLSGLAAGSVQSQPCRWETRRKAVLRLPQSAAFQPALDTEGRLSQIQLDLGQVISAEPRALYPNDRWTKSQHNECPALSEEELIVEYTAHPEACFHFEDGSTLPVSSVGEKRAGRRLQPVAPATQTVTLRVVETDGGKPVPVKLHVHGEAGEYLSPVDRHRRPNTAWYEDYSVDFVHLGAHYCTYIDGEALLRLPLGKVFIEISKGFEIKPIRKKFHITSRTRTIDITLDRVLPWRERGWITADTHVHFLSPQTARLEGAAEGVNVVNLLASQWGELFTNIGDFDGTTTLGAKETGGDGEYLVRVGTENRQHVLGHISLLGYQGRIITPLTTGGPDESALGDPVEILLSEWARQCRRQGGIAILPHFPNPRGEHASCLVQGDIDAIEMTSWGDLYHGIDPYSLSDWYRYLNCGYFVPAVGGTDKMSAEMPVGGVRTYARLPEDQPFTYTAWMDALRAGNTFVTYGPLLEFAVEGKPPGARFSMSRTGGTVTIDWEAASVTTPLSRVELVVNGEIVDGRTVKPGGARGYFRYQAERSVWLALLVRGQYPGHKEMIAAHTSPVMIDIQDSPFYAAADALTILEQIEGTMAYLDTLATFPGAADYKRMRMILTAAHRRLHNRMHAMGHDHVHTPAQDHREHHSR